jgi:radical SAM superfamily enzyme YgiQ (UPF0313 family)
MKGVRVLLIATYELGKQPFGLASPAAFLRAAGHHVDVVDASVEKVSLAAVRQADLVGFHLPMHTATRMAAPMIGTVRAANPAARVVCYGLYAPINEAYLRGLGVTAIVGGEFEAELVRIANDAAHVPPLVSFERLAFTLPDRSTLPGLSNYAKIDMGDGAERIAGYTEASRGCKHLCRHCPVVPVYEGKFRIVPQDIVLGDIRQQVAAGARHIAFGDPDFFNGPTHAMRIAEGVAREFPGLTYDVTIKVEHLLRHRELLARLAETGCVLVTTAVESLDDHVLELLDKGHTRADFVEAVDLCQAAGLALSPTFIPFTPWTTWESYRDLLRTLASLGLATNVAPVQLALRLLITNGSRLLELDDIREAITGWDPVALTHRWKHRDPSLDELSTKLLQSLSAPETRVETFARICREAGLDVPALIPPRAMVPFLTEPWYCCAEPNPEQLAVV